METQNQEPVHTPFFQTLTAKIIMVGLLTLVLLIPLAFVRELIYERSTRQEAVTGEINDKWGKDVFFYGPILKVPYKVFTQTVSVNEKTKETIRQVTASTEYAYFFPETLKNQSDVVTKKLNRNNYESVVFTTNMKFNGTFIKPDFSSKNIAAENIVWDKATLLIRTSNLKSIKDVVKIKLGARDYPLEPIFSDKDEDEIASLETGFLDANVLSSMTNFPFDFSLKYNGSKQIRFVPVGKTTDIAMKSNWSSPSFQGNFLPGDTTKKITDKGFTADWKVLHVNRPFSQQSFENLPNLSAYGFGVDFVVPVDQYQQNERASKYGFLVIGLTFLIFFLIQAISKINIHIFQYTMIGLALIMFYTLLISITEHSSFSFAYAISGSAVVTLVSLYSYSILKNIKFPVFIFLSLSALYLFLYIIIQLEDYALLVGSIGLFLILAIVMYTSRKIDWKR